MAGAAGAPDFTPLAGWLCAHVVAVVAAVNSCAPFLLSSRRLNPNNLHYDSELAERYKHMNRCVPPGSALPAPSL